MGFEESIYQPIYNSYTIAGVSYVLVVLVCITLSWMGLQQLRLDVFLKNPKSPFAKILLIFLSIVLGYQVTSFLFQYFQMTSMLRGMF